jgi:hypothetical protein
MSGHEFNGAIGSATVVMLLWVFGASNWNSKIQKPSDDLLKLQVIKAQAEILCGVDSETGGNSPKTASNRPTH